MHSQNWELCRRPPDEAVNWSNRFSTDGHPGAPPPAAAPPVLVVMNLRPLSAAAAADLVRSKRLAGVVGRRESEVMRFSSCETCRKRDEALWRTDDPNDDDLRVSNVFLASSASSGSSRSVAPPAVCTLWTATPSSRMSRVISTYGSPSSSSAFEVALPLRSPAVSKGMLNLALFLEDRLEL